jgi:hypothetical protein
MALVGAEFVAFCAGEVMTDDYACEVINRITCCQALQCVIRFIIGVLELRRPAGELHVDAAAEGGGSVDVIGGVEIRAEGGRFESFGEFVGALGERGYGYLRMGAEEVSDSGYEVEVHGVAVVIEADEDVAGGGADQFDAGADGALRGGVLDEFGGGEVLADVIGGAIGAAIGADEEFVGGRGELGDDGKGAPQLRQAVVGGDADGGGYQG